MPATALDNGGGCDRYVANQPRADNVYCSLLGSTATLWYRLTVNGEPISSGCRHAMCGRRMLGSGKTNGGPMLPVGRRREAAESYELMSLLDPIFMQADILHCFARLDEVAVDHMETTVSALDDGWIMILTTLMIL